MVWFAPEASALRCHVVICGAAVGGSSQWSATSRNPLFWKPCFLIGEQPNSERRTSTVRQKPRSCEIRRQLKWSASRFKSGTCNHLKLLFSGDRLALWRRHRGGAPSRLGVHRTGCRAFGHRGQFSRVWLVRSKNTSMIAILAMERDKRWSVR